MIFDQKESISDPWPYDDNKKFDFEITDNTKTYDLILILTHSDVFSYENIYLNATTIFPDGSKTTNPVSLPIEMSSASYFKSNGKYSIILEQYSRKDSLEGISAIELKVLESQKE